MGAARLRITSFPTIGTGPDACDWTKHPTTIKASASFAKVDHPSSLNHGMEPAASNDDTVPRFTWWDHKGTTEWVEYDFGQPVIVSASSVYWFDDTGKGGCRVPQSWRLLYNDGGSWKPVENTSDYGTAVNRFNRVTFKPITTAALRLEAQLKNGVSGGVLEWKVDQQQPAKPRIGKETLL
jgi:hypothetical protein